MVVLAMEKYLNYYFSWYEMDQDLEVGKTDNFTLTADEKSFYSGFLKEGTYFETTLAIKEITHPELGKIKKITTSGLDYHILLENGSNIEVNAEEHPGKVRNYKIQPSEWNFSLFLFF